MNNCKGIVGLIFGHDFQPRYSTVIEKDKDLETHIVIGVDRILHTDIKVGEDKLYPTSEIYVRDICQRCGKTIPSSLPDFTNIKKNILL